MDFSSINWLSVSLATIAAYAIGAVYYTVLGKPWMKAARIDPATAKVRYSAFVTAFLAELIMAIVLFFVLDDITFAGTFSEEFDLKSGLAWSFIFWLGFAAMVVTVNRRYEGFGWDLTIIDCIHWLLVLLAMGAIIGWFGPSDAGLS
jgi:hypothetical protein